MTTCNQKCSLRCYAPLTFISMQKIYGINCFFPEIMMIKGPSDLTEQEVIWPHPSKSSSLRSYLPLMVMSLQKM